MDFMERIFGLSPDGGSGMYELLVVLLVAVAVMVVARRAWHQRRID